MRTTCFILILFINIAQSLLEIKNETEIEAVANVHVSWFNQAVEGLLTAKRDQIYAKLPYTYRSELQFCWHVSEDLKSKAKCVAKALRYSKHSDWIGAFRVQKDSQKKKTYKSLKLRGLKRLQYINSLALLRRRHKRSFFGRFPQTQTSYLSRSNFLQPTFSRMAVETFSNIFGVPRDSSWKDDFERLKHLTNLAKNERHERLMLHELFQQFSSAPTISGNSLRNDSTAAILTEMLGFLTTEASKYDKNSVEFLSPSLMSIGATENNYFRLLSPALFGLSNGSADSIFSLPQLLSSFPADEKQMWMNLIMHVTGSSKAVKEILNQFDNPKTPEGKQYQYDLLMQEQIDTVFNSFNRRQNDDIDSKGYTFLNKEQLLNFYGPHGAFKDAHYRNGTEYDAPWDFDFYGNLSQSELEETIDAVVYELADEENELVRKWQKRLKQAVLSPLVLSGKGILKPGVLNYVVLSPRVFVPAILSPKALGPVILSPLVGVPAILSPNVLSPFVLTPGVMTPLILNPKVLSPAILSPKVLSPLILSPTVLSPGILSPSALSGLILSPVVLNPGILSPGVLNANVLSPKVLSKK